MCVCVRGGGGGGGGGEQIYVAHTSFAIQWTPSDLATFGASRSVLIRGVASFQGVDLYYEVYIKCPD